MKGLNRQSAVYSKDPVNLSTGNFIYQKKDIEIKGPMPLSFIRFYNAQDENKGVMGTGWIHNLEIHLKKHKDGTITLYLEDGKEQTYIRTKDETYQGINGATNPLTQTGECYQYQTGDTTCTFNQAGRLITKQNQNGETITLTYNQAGQLEKARQKNTCLTYIYEGEQLKTVTDHTGRTITLTYEAGSLKTVQNPEGETLSYTYNANGKIKAIENPRGIKTVKNRYDTQNRITKQTFPDGGIMTYTYNEAEKTVTETLQNGSTIIHQHDSQLRNIKNIYEDGEEHYTYNSRNQKTTITDKNGNTTKYSYDNKGNLTQVINPLGEKTNLTYDSKGKLLSLKINGQEKQKNKYDSKGRLIITTDAIGRTTSLTYNQKGQLVTIKNPDQSQVTLTYDRAGNIKTIENQAGSRITYSYDSLNRIQTITDPMGNQTSYTYDKADRIKTIKNPQGHTKCYTYNKSGKQTGITDYDGSKTTTTYNNINKPETITDKEGNQTRYTYDKMWNINTITLATGAQIHYTYNKQNRLETIKTPQGNTITYTYDPNGNITSIKNGTGETIKRQYDALNRLTKETDAKGGITSYTYDKEGHITEIIDPMGGHRKAEYDKAGQKTKEIDPMGNETSYTYNLLGQIETIKDPAGRITRYHYQKGGKLTGKTNPDGTKETYTYDLNGNITSIKNGQGQSFYYEYDCFNNLIKKHDGGKRVKEYTYDIMGNCISIKDQMNRIMQYGYSKSGRLQTVIDPLGVTTRYIYDSLGNLTKMMQSDSANQIRETIYKRNNWGQLECLIDPLGNQESYSYDELGRIVEKTDKEGYKTKYQYNQSGNLESISYKNNKSVNFSYNGFNRLAEINDWTGIIQIESNPYGVPEKITDCNGNLISYEWNNFGDYKGITYPDGTRVCYEYDDALKLKTLKYGNDQIRYYYDMYGRLTEKQYENGVKSIYTYNEDGLLKSLTHQNHEGVLECLNYSYDLAGNKTKLIKWSEESDKVSVFQYAYDILGRLISVEENEKIVRAYEYDAYGNRIKMLENGKETKYTYNVMNQLVQQVNEQGIKDYLYDARGNLIQVKSNGIIEAGYVYDETGKMIKASSVNGEAEYTYNGLGQRISMYTNKEGVLKQINYTLDLTKGYNNLLQQNKNGEVQNYIWDGMVVGAAKETTEHAKKGLGMDAYFMLDDLGTPMHLLNQEGNSIDHFNYDEFGIERDSYGMPKEVVHQQPFGFTGYQTDEISGLMYAQARYYNKEMGSFISADKNCFINPYNSKSMNLYTYVQGNPLKYIDPSGEVYIVAWSYGSHDCEEFEEWYIWHQTIRMWSYGNLVSATLFQSPTIGVVAGAATYLALSNQIKIDGETDDWTEDMWNEFDARSSFARAANTKYNELVELGISPDDIVFERIDDNADFIASWEAWSEYDSVQELHIYSHGCDGRPEVYGGTKEYIADTHIFPVLNWQISAYTQIPVVMFYGCNTATEVTQEFANEQGVLTYGNINKAQFSYNANQRIPILTWQKGGNVYMGTYNQKSNQKSLLAVLWQYFMDEELAIDKEDMIPYESNCDLE